MKNKDRWAGVFNLVSALLCLIADFFCYALFGTLGAEILVLCFLLMIFVGCVFPPAFVLAFILLILILCFLPLLEFLYLTVILVMAITGIWLLFNKKRGAGTRILLSNIVAAKIMSIVLFCFFAVALFEPSSEGIGLTVFFALAVATLVASVVLDTKLTARLKKKKKKKMIK